MKSKIVLITGCSSGFGRKMATKFLENGWTVLATMRNVKERQKIFDEERKRYGNQFILLELDVTSAADRNAIVEFLREKNFGLDCLINNAGYMLLGALESTGEKQMREQFEVNFFGPMLLIRDLLPFLRERKGIVINISSVFGFMTWPLTSVYCASKFALEGLSESLRQELQSQGVRVSLVEPGSHPTPSFSDNIQWSQRDGFSESFYHSDTEGYRRFRKFSRKESVSIDDICRVAFRLASQKSSPFRVQVGRGMSLLYRFTRWFPELMGIKLMRFLAGRIFRRKFTEAE